MGSLSGALLHEFFDELVSTSALWKFVYYLSSLEGRLLPQPSALCELVYCISSLEGRLLPQLFGRSSIASALCELIYCLSSL